MNKGELVTKIAKETGATKLDTEKVLNSFMETVKDTLKEGDKVSLLGFGTFDTSERSARKGRNPRNGEEIDIPAKTVPKFKAGKTLKDAVNED
jgi:DNA-binding protein HU-beta